MSKFDFNEGVRYATKLIEDAAHTPDAFFTLDGSVKTVLRNMETSLATRSNDFARGAQSVCRKVTAHLTQKGNVTHAR